ncbi:MAG: methyltransferase domain-containing protein [Phycisphaerae bacterium]|nr:methyltransferase domain-containing protein [Phycisphaerae bacterium]
MEVTKVLKCPKTGNKLRFDVANSVVVVEDSPITYPINDGIVDFCPEAEDRISASYDGFASIYDSYMTSSSLSMKLFNMLFWGTDSDFEAAKQVLSYLPAEFDGVLLDVPVGTGVFTDSLYARYPNATIIAADYSMGMLQQAKKRFEKQGLNNICLIRADVAKLPVIDGAVNIVLSMAGLHAFPDKQAAVAEMGRVLHPDGSLVASCYTKGDSWRCDWFVKLFGVPKGCFNPPFFTKDDVGSYLEGFNIKRQLNMKLGVYFEAVRK